MQVLSHASAVYKNHLGAWCWQKEKKWIFIEMCRLIRNFFSKRKLITP